MAAIGSFGAFFLLFSVYICAQNSLTIDQQRICDQTNNEYFDISSLHCEQCGTDQVVDPSGSKCICKPGRAQLNAPTGPGRLLERVECVPCPDGTAPNKLANKCLACDSSTNTSSTLPSSYKAPGIECTCPDPLSQYLVETTTGKRCAPCLGGSFVDPNDPYTCIRCPDVTMTRVNSKCTCPETRVQIGRRCFDTSSLGRDFTEAAAYIVTYNNVIGTNGELTAKHQFSDSAVFHEQFLPAAIGCKSDLSRTACQALANLCVLQMYNTQSVACRQFRQNTQDSTTISNGYSEWRRGLPWLYYQENSATSVLSALDIQKDVALEGPDSILPIKLAAYALNGTWLGFVDFSDQLLLCDYPRHDTLRALRFGSNQELKCFFNIRELFQSPEPVFYDPYFVDSGGELRPLPVRVVSYLKDGTSQVNLNVNEKDWPDDTLVRRFMVYDNVSAKRFTATTTTTADSTTAVPAPNFYDPNYVPTNAPEILVFASAVTLRVSLQEGSFSKIYPPVIDITYTSRFTNALPEVTVAEPGDKILYRSIYSMNLDQFRETMVAIFSTAMVLILVIWVFRIYQFLRSNQSQPLDAFFLVEVIVVLCATTASIFFWGMFCVSCYWFLFFKAQAHVHVLLPFGEDLTNFYAVIGTAIFGQCVWQLSLLLRQTSCDVFFVDWERPRGKTHNKVGNEDKPVQVSIWRTIFVTNEWNELQTQRLINFEAHLLAFLFFLKGLNYEYLSTPQPDGDDLTAQPTHMLLRFCVNCFFWLLLGGVQAIYMRVIHHRWISDPLGGFVDILSVANISAVIFDSRFHGYYIHGRSVNEQSDTSMQEMAEQLRKEEDGGVARRGLEAGNDEQCFELYITPQLRKEYDEICQSIDSDGGAPSAANRQAAAGANVARNRQHGPAPTNALATAHGKLTKMLTTFINEYQGKLATNIKEKTFLQRLLGSPPDVLSQSNSIFYKDEGSFVFRNVLLIGSEWDMLLFDLLIFTFWDLFLSSTFISVLLTYLVNYLLLLLRQKRSQANITRKTLIDDRFLI